MMLINSLIHSNVDYKRLYSLLQEKNTNIQIKITKLQIYIVTNSDTYVDKKGLSVEKKITYVNKKRVCVDTMVIFPVNFHVSIIL